MMSYTVTRSPIGICPGADADSPTAKLNPEPNRPPTIRVTDPNGPIDMLISGIRAFASACVVAASSVSTSMRSRGITATMATSAPSRSASRKRSTRYSRPGV